MTIDINSVLPTASAGLAEVATEWMPSSRIRAFAIGDPGQIWLEKFGWKNGFFTDPASPYNYASFQFDLDREFRQKWRNRFAKGCPQVCQEAYHVRYAYRLKQTLQRMSDVKTQLIYQPALWWAPDGIYGVPDFLARLSWLKEKFPTAYQDLENASIPGNLPQDMFVLLEVRFSKSSGEQEEAAYNVVQEQLRLMNYVLGKIQGWAAPRAFLVNRADPSRLIAFDTDTGPDAPLNAELQGYVRQYAEIVRNGKNLFPGRDALVSLDLRLEDRWKMARQKLAWKNSEGGDPIVLHRMNEEHKQKLAAAGFRTIDDLLKTEPAAVPLEATGLKPYAREFRALLQANRTGLPVVPGTAPQKKEFEFFVDFEYFSDLGMARDPFGDGKGELIFMIGVGTHTTSGWHYQDFVAQDLSTAEELRILKAFTAYLGQATDEAHIDPTRTVLYHWSQAEINASRKALEHHPHGPDLTQLPWHDLLADFKNEGCALPGVWNFGLKATAKALGKLDPKYDPRWIGDLDDGSGVIVLGTKTYQEKDVLKTDEMKILREYLQADCRALHSVLSWMRNDAPGQKFGAPGQAYVGWDQVARGYQESKRRTAYSGLNDGKGAVVYLHPGPLNKKGEPTGIQPLNHLIWGDWLEILDEQAGWYKIHSRNTYGWVHKSWVQAQRLLEINFVDVGQGDGCLVVTPDDRKLLIDAGEKDNLYRFLRWRFGSFKKQVNFEALIISHPDSDHYAGFGEFFKDTYEARHIHFKTIYHNGILEAKKREIEVEEDGQALKIGAVAQLIQTRDDLKAALQTSPGGDYPKLLKAADSSGRVSDICMLKASAGSVSYMPGFEQGRPVEIEVLGPLLEEAAGQGYLRWFEDAGKTKNGHSVVLRMKYGKARFLLGGDLNQASEELLLSNYAGLALAGTLPAGDERILPARQFLEAEVAKSCHHGSADTSPAFLQAVNALGSVVSSGDEEPHCHPRPESLGILGKFGRGQWPMIFSTELARSTRETVQHPYRLQRKLIDAQNAGKETEFIEELVGGLERSVAIYGMITLRTDGEKILLAQKLEQPRSPGQKWDQHVIEFQNGEWTYSPKGEK